MGSVQVGPLGALSLAELRAIAAATGRPLGLYEGLQLRRCARSCIFNQVKATYLRVGKPRSLRAAGSLFFGTPYRQGGPALPYRPAPPPDAHL